MDYRKLGNTDLSVSVISLGTGGPSQLGQRVGGDREQAMRVVRTAIDLGVNLIDTAAVYGTESVVGEAIHDVPRDTVLLSTKAPPNITRRRQSPAELVAAVDASLAAMGVDYIDIYSLHGVEADHYCYAHATLLPTLRKLQKQGKIRYVGITEAGTPDPSHHMYARAVHDDWDVFLLQMTPLNQSVREHVLPRAIERGIGVLAAYVVARIKPEQSAAHGFVTPAIAEDDARYDFAIGEDAAHASDKYDLAYRFVRDEPGVHSVLVGTGKVEHLRSNAQSLAKPALSDDIRKRLTSWLPAGRRAMPMTMLSASQIDQFNATGYLILRGVLDELLLRRIADEADHLWRWKSLESPDNMRTEFRDGVDGRLVSNKLDPVLDLSPLFCEVARHPVILGAAASVLGESPALLKDKLIFKPPGHPGFSCHQDHKFWKGFTEQTLTLAVAIDGGDKHNGALQVFRGCHRKGLLNKPGEVFLTDENRPHRIWRRRIDTRPGDVVLFHCMIPHQSGPNRSTLPRRTLNLTYSPQSLAGKYEDYYAHFADLRGEPLDEAGRARLHFEPPVRTPW